MTFVSTQQPDDRTFPLAQALRLGPAPDGGLFMPASLEPLSEEALASFESATLPEIAGTVLSHLIGRDLEETALRKIAEDALDFPIPLRPVTEQMGVLEIFHGPTLAFKDGGCTLSGPIAGGHATTKQLHHLHGFGGDVR